MQGEREMRFHEVARRTTGRMPDNIYADDKMYSEQLGHALRALLAGQRAADGDRQAMAMQGLVTVLRERALATGGVMPPFEPAALLSTALDAAEALGVSKKMKAVVAALRGEPLPAGPKGRGPKH